MLKRIRRLSHARPPRASPIVSWVGLEPFESHGAPSNWKLSSMSNPQLAQDPTTTAAPRASDGGSPPAGPPSGGVGCGSSVSSASTRPKLMNQGSDAAGASSAQQRQSSLNGSVAGRNTPPVKGSFVENGSTTEDDPGVEMGPMIHPLTMEDVEEMALPDEPTPPQRMMTADDGGYSSVGGLLQTCPAPSSSKKRSGRSSANAGISQGMSAMYGKLLVVLGFAFPLSEVISSHIPYSFYEAFYLYLYVGCIVFLLFIYGEILVTKRRDRLSDMSRTAVSTLSMDSFYSVMPDQQTVIDPETGRVLWMAKPSIHYGSFYLRLGTVAFGVGNMIYSGLEVGQYFEHQEGDECFTLLIALTPACRIIFTFIQMYFIFLNSKMLISRFTTLARFGLMHMIATNLCIWLYVLVQESKHELLEGYHNVLNGAHAESTSRHRGVSESNLNTAVHGQSPITVEIHGSGAHLGDSHASLDAGENSSLFPALSSLLFAGTSDGNAGSLANGSQSWDALYVDTHSKSTSLFGADYFGNGTAGTPQRLISLGEVDTRTDPLTLSLVGSGPHSIHECLRTNIIGELVQNASPFLFPCVIEYSLICAAILYVMWKNVAPVSSDENGEDGGVELVRHRSGMMRVSSKRSRHHYSMDCAGANRGLFTGIIILVFTIISLILFFVLINREEMQDVAVFEANVSELVLYLTSALASIIGMARMRRLRYDAHRNLELDSILLIIAQTGLFLYSIFIVIGGYFTISNRATSLMLITGLTMLFQCILQTMFILDASRRYAHNPTQAREKPGREFVTFLIVSNLAMWAINTLETSRANAHPVHLRFFGEWAWTIIVHISMPLAIFYRFHSTVCLCEVWTKAYKMRELRHTESVVG